MPRFIVLSILFGCLGVAQAAETTKRWYHTTEERAECNAYDPLRQPFYGDTHVHTTYSQDASTQGTRATPHDAYRFAKGEPLAIQPWDAEGNSLRTIQLRRPLDFTVVTDHSEQIGEVHICKTPGSPGHDSLVCRLYRGYPSVAFFVMNATYSFFPDERWGFCGEDGVHCLDAARTIWQETQAAAEQAYDRSPACRFTSFVGYEWTSIGGAGGHLHRNVVFRNERVPGLPISQMETGSSALELWRQLDATCRDAGKGCEAITIPHNSNLSRGTQFTSSVTPGEPVSAEEVAHRARYERLAEVMQHKGDSECILSGDTTDEACGFEKTQAGGAPEWLEAISGDEETADPRIDTVREALKRGLALEERFGTNPFRFGLIGSTDTHLAAPGLTEERSFQGHGGAGASHLESLPIGLIDNVGYNPGGLAVLWAEENTRDALFEAMLRREAYGTSGNRPTLRFFGGWEYDAALCEAPDLVAKGYAGGVPMGGSLPARPSGANAPVFVANALRDPDATASPLQRIEIVKGWIEEGDLREQVLTVAGGDNGASVDQTSCVQSGPETANLCSVWSDPDFDPAQRAFYYARVLENPSCRWSQWACVEAGIECSDPDAVPEGFALCCSEEHRPVVQERAWSSPIWFDPVASN